MASICCSRSAARSAVPVVEWDGIGGHCAVSISKPPFGRLSFSGLLQVSTLSTAIIQTPVQDDQSP